MSPGNCNPCSSRARATSIGERPSSRGKHRCSVDGAARADEPKAWNTCQSFEAMLDQRLIMSRPGVVSCLFEEANGGRKTNGACHVGSARLELLRAVLEFSAIELDSVSHIAADGLALSNE